MAISDDTAALVAAQLTVAWASRMGASPQTAVEAGVVAMYERMLLVAKQGGGKDTK